MIVLIPLALIVTVVALIAFAVTKRSLANATTPSAKDSAQSGHVIAGIIAVVGFVLFLIFGFIGSTYSQDAGEATVLKDVTGNITGSTTETGLHWKAPWIDTVTFNIRNQQVIFNGANTATNPDNTGGKANGPQITAQDKDAVTDQLDVAIRYSIKANSVIAVYKSFKTEDNFKSSFIMQDVRSAVRLVPNAFTTKSLLTNRAAVEAAIQKELEKRWVNDGVSVDSVSLQEVIPPASVKAAYAAAQTAQINISTQQAKLDAAKVSAQQQVVQAQAKADANNLLAQSLTTPVLEQNYLDTLAKLSASGNLVVVPEGFGGILNVK